jgi:hypothetical protein
MGRPQGPEQFAVLALKCRPVHVLARAYHRPAMEEALASLGAYTGNQAPAREYPGLREPGPHNPMRRLPGRPQQLIPLRRVKRCNVSFAVS